MCLVYTQPYFLTQRYCFMFMRAMTDFFLHTGGLINLLSTVNASLTALCLFITSVPATPMVASSKHGLKSRDGGD